jgi:hypothetical protein
MHKFHDPQLARMAEIATLLGAKMVGLTTAMEDNILDAVFGQGYTQPGNTYIGLATVHVTTSDTAASVTEPTGGEWGTYARVLKVNNSTNWPNASAGSKSNGTAITFAASVAGTGATILDWFIADSGPAAGTAGTILTYAPFATPFTVNNGDPATNFPIGTLLLGVS